MKRFEIFFGIIKIPLDFVMTILALISAYELRIWTENLEGFARPIDYNVFPSINEYLQASSYAAVALIIAFALGKRYSLKSTQKFSHEVGQVISSCILWAMLIITTFFVLRILPFSRLAMAYSWTLTVIFIIAGRGITHIIQKILLKAGIGNRKLLFIGNNEITQEIFQKLSKDASYKILGTLDDHSQHTKLKKLGTIKEIKEIIAKFQPDEIIQTKFEIDGQQNEEIIELCDLHHINYHFTPNQLEVRRSNIEIKTINTIPLINLKPTPLDGWGKVAKRIMDIIGSIFGLVILSPILLITAIAIKLDSKGPILFTKLEDGSPVKRIGQHGKPFKFYKFRSMKPNTHHLRYTELQEKNTRQGTPLVKIKNDPRITRVGKFIRKYSIDELPQLWNVLWGHMSLVGPRPHLPEEVDKYQSHHRFVLTIKPGLTGMAQANGRSDLDFEKEIKLDRYYIENWSLLLDIKIILKTILIIIRGYSE